MPNRDLNETLDCIFTLVTIYLNQDLEDARHGLCRANRSLGTRALATLRSYGLARYADEGDSVCLTDEGVREACGVLKYLQLALGESLGATREEVRRAEPRLFADEAAAGTGPLTMSEFMAAVAEGGRLSPRPRAPFSPTALAKPPDSYHREAGDDRALLIRLQLSLRGRGQTWQRDYYGGYYGEPFGGRDPATCWRKVVVPAGFTLLDLHVIIQRCLSWEDRAPFGFLLARGRDNLLVGERAACGGIARPQTRKKKFVEEDASALRLADVFPRTREATYAYGAGSPWEVDVRVVEVRPGIAALGPQLIDGVGDAPPEWVADADEFLAFRDELYRSGRNVIRMLSAADERGFAPFSLGVARERLAGFERDRARWQEVLDGRAERDADAERRAGAERSARAGAHEVVADDIPM